MDHTQSFNPRSPRGGATERPRASSARLEEFQSTLPAWGSDLLVLAGQYVTLKFQSTLPAWGSDLSEIDWRAGAGAFQSTLPAWGSDRTAQYG